MWFKDLRNVAQPAPDAGANHSSCRVRKPEKPVVGGLLLLTMRVPHYERP